MITRIYLWVKEPDYPWIVFLQCIVQITIRDIAKDAGMSLLQKNDFLMRILKDSCHIDTVYIDRWLKLGTSKNP